ncbi:MAG: DNA primase [Oscillospiraceae bacterium]|nr:DNA primase [Oscillospiraceae bacterium]MDE6933888.1 DNA primase [Oscillospiraceae bacterium]
MAFPQRFLDELVDRSDIVDVVSSYVSLSKKGGNYFGLCPFHNEKTGSFSVAPDKQIYYCFGCHHGGGVIQFVMEIENLDFPNAVRFLAKRANMEVPEDNTGLEESRRRQRVLAVNRDAARWFYSNLSRPEGAAVAAYLERRKISRKTAMNFGLGASLDQWDALLNAMLEKGYTKADLLAAGLVVSNQKGRIYDKFRNRLMFPVIDVKGDVVAFGGRVLDKSEPKYMNTTETIVYSKRRNLYGINLAKKTKRPNFILCEGNIDVITLHQAGFDNAVASMGTALTTEQTKILSRYTKELVLCFDNDNAGQLATQKNIELLKDSEFNVRILQLPRRLADGEYVKQDVDDFIKFQGAAAFEAILNGSANQMDYRMEAVAAKYDLSDPEQKIAYGGEISALIASLSNAVEREVYAGRAAETAGISRTAMLTEVERARRKKGSQERRTLQRENLNAAALRQPRDRTIRYTDLRSAMAEEGVVCLLLLDGALADKCRGLPAEAFSSPFLGKLFALLTEAWSEGRTMTAASLSAHCTPEEMSHLSAILQRPESLANAERALEDYIQVILRSAEKRQGERPEDPLLAAVEKYKQKKGNGGKQS